MLALTPPNSEVFQDDDTEAFLNGRTDQYPARLTESWLIGTPDEIKQQLQTFIDLGFTHFMLWFMDAPRQDGMRLFIEQVAPVSRQRV